MVTVNAPDLMSASRLATNSIAAAGTFPAQKGGTKTTTYPCFQTHENVTSKAEICHSPAAAGTFHAKKGTHADSTC